MAKAVLVIDMPENCAKCPLFGNHYSDMCCKGLSNRSIDYPYPKDFKQDWCPLVTMPERKEWPLGTSDREVIAEHRAWNKCIDEILKGANRDKDVL